MTANELIEMLEEINRAYLEKFQADFDRIEADRQPLIDFLETLHATDKHYESADDQQ